MATRQEKAVTPRRPRTAAATASQLDLFEAGAAERWSLSRPFAASRLRDAALRHLEGVRRHFPELDAVTVRVGRTKSRRAHAWASLDPDQPTVWIKPGALTRFTVAHEFTHLLQARGLVPRGEKTADLYALARHPDLIDKAPSYLAVPRILFSIDGMPRPGVPALLHRLAVRAIGGAAGRARVAIRLFERDALAAGLPVLAAALGDSPGSGREVVGAASGGTGARRAAEGSSS